ncbi:YqjF family protein [Geodermatophilus sp. SYSU D00696]
MSDLTTTGSPRATWLGRLEGVLPEPVTDTAPRGAGRTLFTQGWRDVAFVHWAVDPAVVAPLLPPGTRPDVHAGSSWVGLVPFRMRRIGVLGSPGLPWVGSFLETNVRLYSVDDRGRRGVVFRSLDADRLLPVLVARAAGLPYLWSRMRIARDGDRITYSSHRRWPGPRGAGGRIEVRVGERLTDPGPLERFLTGRWGLHQTARGRTVYWPNEHPAWPLHRAELLAWDGDLLAAAGPPGVGGPPDSVLFSPGVDVRFGPRS